MSTLKVDSIVDGGGSGAPTAPNGLTVGTTAIPTAGALSNRNLIINGAMQVAQRGTSVTGATSGGYSTVDRWAHNASGGTLSFSQQALTVGQTDIPSQFKYFFRVNATTGDNNAGIWQKIEGVDRVQGTVTLSFYAKGTNPSSGNFEIELDQSFGSSGSAGPSYATNHETFTVTSSWQRFTKTISVPDITGSTIGGGNDYYRIYFRQPNSDTGTSAWTLDITGVQLEVGDTATPFEHRSYGDELQRCQRYYEVMSNLFGTGANSSTVVFPISFKVQKRATPSLSASALLTVNDTNGDKNPSSQSLGTSTSDVHGIRLFSGNYSSLTQFRPYYTNVDTVNFDAEL